MNAQIAKLLGSDKGQLAVLVGVGVVGFWIIHNLLKQDVADVAGAVGEAVSGATEAVGGIATGRNTVTANTPYYDTGIFGTLGAGVDKVSGGIFSQFGEWLGGELYQFVNDDNSADNSQSATGNPYSPTGPTSDYREAANNSPVNAQYRATPLIAGK